MEFKIFSIPAIGGENELEEMNKFLRGNKILQVKQKFFGSGIEGFWCYSVSFLKNARPAKGVTGKKPRIDYREVLDEATFARFTVLRTRRKDLAERAAVPAYVVFTNEELAAIAKLGDDASPAMLTGIEGIGLQRVKRFGESILNKTKGETSE